MPPDRRLTPPLRRAPDMRRPDSYNSAERISASPAPRTASMTTPLQSLIACGTKVWLDSIDPDLVRRDRALGATGATSNPIIIADLIKTGRFDDHLARLLRQGLSDLDIAWQLTDHLVREAQQVFLPVWEQTRGDDGYVSFELDPLLEDPKLGPPEADRP